MTVLRVGCVIAAVALCSPTAPTMAEVDVDEPEKRGNHKVARVF